MSSSCCHLVVNLRSYLTLFNVRMDEANHCVLVVIGATKDESAELLAIQDGYRESE